MPSDQAVIVKFDYGSTDLRMLFALEDQLEEVLALTGSGEYDGNEIAVDGSDGLLFLYGPDADQLFHDIEGTLLTCVNISNVVATLRYGSPEAGTKESTVHVGRSS